MLVPVELVPVEEEVAAFLADLPTIPKKLTFSGAAAMVGLAKLVLSVAGPILEEGLAGLGALDEDDEEEPVVDELEDVVVVVWALENDGGACDTGGISEKSNSAIVFFKSSSTP